MIASVKAISSSLEVAAFPSGPVTTAERQLRTLLEKTFGANAETLESAANARMGDLLLYFMLEATFVDVNKNCYGTTNQPTGVIRRQAFC